MIVRAYNSGIAFRYHYEGTNQNLCINSESTTFVVPEETYCWFAPYAQALHLRKPVENWPGEAERPLTLELKSGLYASLLEAGMVDYSRTKFFVKGGEKNIIRCKMYDSVEDFIPFTTPWRVVMIAESPKSLLENNDLVLNLNDPCQIRNPNWIKPGTVIRCVSLSMEGAKKQLIWQRKEIFNMFILMQVGMVLRLLSNLIRELLVVWIFLKSLNMQTREV